MIELVQQLLLLDIRDEAWKRGIYGGLEVSIMTLAFTFFLEMLSIPTVRQVWKQPGGLQLYATAVVYNIRNHFLLGIPTFAVAVVYLCTELPIERHWGKASCYVLALIFLHDLMYYQAHKTFHSNATLYQFHKFHHRFHFHTPPVTANGVSSVEYMLAYVLPFAAAAALVHPTEFELRIAVTITSAFNLLEHTPRLERIAWPPWLVSPHQHLEHHRKGTLHYAAPVFNVDWLHECWKAEA